MLVVWFTSPNLDLEHSEIIKDLMPIMTRSTITDDSFRGSPGCNEALQCLKESPVGSNMLRMNQMGFSADENVCTGEASIDSRCI